jgi:hypothetical protein
MSMWLQNQTACVEQPCLRTANDCRPEFVRDSSCLAEATPERVRPGGDGDEDADE